MVNIRVFIVKSRTSNAVKACKHKYCLGPIIRVFAHCIGGEQYCDAEVFSPSCAADEVVVVSEALYGRMRVGKCIEAEYAFSMGCASNVLPYLDLLCSGRRSCSVPIAAWNLLANSQRNCTSKLQSYLEVHFSCIKGLINLLLHNTISPQFEETRVLNAEMLLKKLALDIYAQSLPVSYPTRLFPPLTWVLKVICLVTSHCMVDAEA